jgi:hypothetical protein
MKLTNQTLLVLLVTATVHTIEGHLFLGGTAFYQSKCTKG